MGSSNSIITSVSNETIDLNIYTCSNRGLILPSKFNQRNLNLIL